MKYLLILSLILLGAGCQKEKIELPESVEIDCSDTVEEYTCRNGDVIPYTSVYRMKFSGVCRTWAYNLPPIDECEERDPICTHVINKTPSPEGTFGLDKYTEQTCINKKGTWEPL